MSRSHATPLSAEVRARLFSHLAAMEQAGLPAQHAFAALELPAPWGRRLPTLLRHLAAGQDIASAGHMAGLFDAFETQLLRAAQSAGSPAWCYRRLADAYTRQAQRRARVKARLFLPAAVLAIALLVQPLPLWVSGALSLPGYLWTVLWPLLALAGVFYLGRTLGRRLRAARTPGLDALLLRLPGWGQLLARRKTRDFFESLGMLLAAGLPMLDALPKALDTLDNAALRETFGGLAAEVEGGGSLTSALRRLAFPGRTRVLGLLVAGEASGSLPELLLRHVAMESTALDDIDEQLAAWLPRLLYAVLALWMIHTLLGGGAFLPQLPDELR
ncbi:type II secretion system F family protein [Pseudomonas sp. RIT-PI-AD]|uniref:type II secretion system F family protein n=1 Tax=Pseudomonas sp. RIT-PI-AD TaxID=3035294 RepID=UPI0021DA330C|nr:type II secretion system F family protein [Pseudomonas sp. RIT-PI-AD]